MVGEMETQQNVQNVVHQLETRFNSAQKSEKRRRVKAAFQLRVFTRTCTHVKV
jgi:hypothetical protein